MHKLIDFPSKRSTDPYLYRLLYINVVTALETYLADAFVNTVLNNRALIRKFVETTPEFRKTKVPLSDIFNQIDRVEKTAKSHLRQIVWHNLARVKRMYKDVLAINTLGKESIFHSVKIRHDLVHRNGKTREGEDIPIDKEDVLELAQEIEQLVEEINSVLSSHCQEVCSRYGI